MAEQLINIQHSLAHFALPFSYSPAEPLHAFYRVHTTLKNSISVAGTNPHQSILIKVELTWVQDLGSFPKSS